MYNTTDNNNIAFKSRIIFVSPRTFNKIDKSLKNKPNYENITTWSIKPFNFETSWQGKQVWCGWRQNVEAGITYGIRSCTAGVAVKKGKPAPLFWHIEDTPANYENLKELKPSIKGTNAVIVGSKSRYYYSEANFNKFKRYAKRNNLAVSYFQDLALKWEAHMAYRAKDDTVFLCVNDVEKPYKYVNSEDTLKHVFSKIKIAQTDTVEYLTPMKEFLSRFKIFNKNRL